MRGKAFVQTEPASIFTKMLSQSQSKWNFSQTSGFGHLEGVCHKLDRRGSFDNTYIYEQNFELPV